MRLLVQVVAALLAVTVAAIAVGMSLYWARATFDPGPALWIVVALAVSSAGYKMLTPLYFGHAPRGMAVLLAVVFVASLSFDVIGELGFQAVTRGAKLDDHAEHVARYRRKERAVADAQRELAAAPAPAEPSAALRRKAEREKALGGRCETPRERQSRACQDAATYEADAETARVREDARAAADKMLSAARAALAAEPVPPESVDPQAAAVRRVLAPLVALTERSASTLFNVLVVVLLESAQIAGAYLVFNPPAFDGAGPRRSAPATPRTGRRPNVAGEVLLGTLERLADGRMSWPGVTVSDGAIRAPQRTLAAALGLKTASAAARALGALEADGLITISTGPGGTCVRLVV